MQTTSSWVAVAPKTRSDHRADADASKSNHQLLGAFEIRRMWETQGATLLFNHLFVDFSRIKTYFGFPQSELVENIVTSPQMIAHFKQSWIGLGIIVSHTPNGPAFAAAGKGLGYNHFKFEIERQDVHKFLESFKAVLRDVLKSEYQGDLKETWNIWCRALEDTFIMGYNEALVEKKSHREESHRGDENSSRRGIHTRRLTIPHEIEDTKKKGKKRWSTRGRSRRANQSLKLASLRILFQRMGAHFE